MDLVPDVLLTVMLFHEHGLFKGSLVLADIFAVSCCHWRVLALEVSVEDCQQSYLRSRREALPPRLLRLASVFWMPESYVFKSGIKSHVPVDGGSYLGSCLPRNNDASVSDGIWGQVE